MELGKNTDYKKVYGADVLCAIPRKKEFWLEFFGYDIWTCYEVSWLNTKGKPICAILTIFVPVHSEFIIESKSLKLYLNSFNNKQFESQIAVSYKIRKDLEQSLQTELIINLETIEQFAGGNNAELPGFCLDNLDVECKDYESDKSLLKTNNQAAKEELYTHLFRSNCRVTNQPDYASLYFTYKGLNSIIYESLLKYLVSYRNHMGFHEECIDNIFHDLNNVLNPEFLLIYGRFTRRGGIDINPVRSNQPINLRELNTKPLIRQ